MAEEGVVRVLQRGNMALVEAVKSDACSSCGAKGACHAMGGNKIRVVPAVNQPGAQVGDRVQLAVSRTGLMKASFLVYMVPVMALMAGALTGQKLGPSWGWDPTTAAVVVSLSALAVCWLGISQLSKILAKRREFTVRIVRVLRKEQADAVDQCATGV